MNTIIPAGILAIIIAIVTLFIPERWRSKKLTLIFFVLISVILCTAVTNLNSEQAKLKRVSRAAFELDRRRYDFSDRAFIEASLAFLEQHKDLYPESYNRAVKKFDKLKSKEPVPATQGLEFLEELRDLEEELQGTIRGIAVVNSKN